MSIATEGRGARVPVRLAGFAGKLAWADGVAGEHDAREVDGPALARLLALFHPSTGGAWQPACSLWAQIYFNTLLVPAMCWLHSRERNLGEAASIMGSFCPTSGVPLVFVVGRHPSDVQPRSEPGHFAELLEKHVDRFIDDLHRVARLSPRMLRESAALTTAWALDQLAPSTPDSACLSRDGLAGTHPAGHDPPRRRFCCLRYRLPGFGPCPQTCPRLQSRHPDPSRRESG